MKSGLPGRREWGASGAVFKQTLKKLVLLLKLLDRTVEIINLPLEQLNPLGQVRHAGGICCGPSTRRASARPIGESMRIPMMGIISATSRMIPRNIMARVYED